MDTHSERQTKRQKPRPSKEGVAKHLGELVHCARTGKLEEFQSRVQDLDFDFDRSDFEFANLLRNVVSRRQRGILECMLRHKSRLLLSEGALRIALLQAIFKADLSMVRSIVEIGKVNVNAARNQTFAIHKAAERGCVDIVQYLVESCGAKLDTSLNSPVHFAAKSSFPGCEDVIKYLVQQANVSVNAGAGSYYGTPLHAACKCSEDDRHTSIQIIQFLIATEKININLASDSGETPFHAACDSKFTEAALLLLGTRKVQINTSKTVRRTSLASSTTPLNAIRDNCLTEVLEYIVDLKMYAIDGIVRCFAMHRFSHEYRGPEKTDGMTPGMIALCVACEQHWSPKIIELFLDSQNLDINDPINNDKSTPLMIVCKGFEKRYHLHDTRRRMASLPPERIQRFHRLVGWMLFDRQANIIIPKTRLRNRYTSNIFDARQEYLMNRWKLISWLVGSQHFSHPKAHCVNEN